MAGVKVIPQTMSRPRPAEALLKLRKNRTGQAYCLRALKLFLLVPIFPLLAYLLLDQTGISAWLVSVGIIPKAILGEGFGHVGLCFSIHYLFSGLRALFKGFSLLWMDFESVHP